MKNDDVQLTAQQSLEIITSMINQTKGNIKKNSFHFILWGWTLTIINTGVYVALNLGYKTAFYLYLLTIPAAIISLVHGATQQKQSQSKSHLDEIYKWLWISLSISCFILSFFGSRINFQLNGVILTMCAAPTLTSGIISKFKPLVYGGIVLWITSILIFIFNNEMQYLLAAAGIAIGYLVPGYLLKSKN